MEYDIIIVGSGPAGISTALHLAKIAPELARKTVVLESGHHPRPKLCAGGILQDGSYVLKKLGLDPTVVPQMPVNEAHFLFEGKGFTIKRDAESFFWVVRREEFDYWLVKEARARGIRIEEDTRVLKVIPSTTGVKVETEKGVFFSKVVVGADGSNGVVRRAIPDKPKSTMSLTLEFFVQPEQMQGIKEPKRPNHAYFDFSMIAEGLQGYVWDFPTQDSATPTRNRGIYHSRVYADTAQNLKDKLNKAMDQEGWNLKDFEVKGHPIRWFTPKSVFSAPRVILVGDAAGVDPLYGEGLTICLGYGDIAARELKEAFEKNDFSFTGYRKRVVTHPMGRCLNRRLKTAKLVYRFRKRWVQKLVWGRFGFLLKWHVEHSLMDWTKTTHR